MSKKEFAIIVDENDNVIEFRERSNVGRYDLHRIVSVWICNNKGETLVARRAYTMNNQPGVWGPAAAGTVAKGEEYIDTAYRELKEEIGITKIVLKQTGKFMTDKNFGESRMCAVFMGVYNGPLSKLSLQPEEVAELRWAKQTNLIHDVATNPHNYIINMQKVIDCL